MYLRHLRRVLHLAHCVQPQKTIFNGIKIKFLCTEATTAFGIATIVLGVDNANLRSELNEKNTVTTSPENPDLTTPENPIPTTPENPVPTTPEVPPLDMSKYRLPTSAVPTNYDLYLYPYLETGLFKGTVAIDTNIKETTKKVVLHSHKLNVTNVKIDGVDGKFETDEDFELLNIERGNGANFNEGTTVNVTIEFEGDMKNRIVGLYSSSYTNPNQEVRHMATSKFEPTYARQAYPCFDEPNLKASYEVHLLKPDDNSYIALSNNPQDREEKVDDGVLVHFSKTVKMSTYLSCFIVSDFNYTETKFNNLGTGEIPFRVYASPHQLNKTTYAGDVGKKAIEYFIDYFNIPYPLPKLDMVAIPDFVSGAMEHWGLVTFRETALLYDASTHSASNKQRVAGVVSHELAHSWFGNLVTMDWWDNLWLNEGFATYIADKGVDVAEPTWEMLEQFQINTLHSILSLDATQGSHPIIQKVETPDQITEVFDSVSYNKGASVLRMLEYVVDPDKFKTGVTNYLKRHEYGNAVTQDLWDEIQKVVGEGLNVTEFMETFTVQMGYPVLTVREDGDNYIFTQKRFLKDYDSAKKQKSSPLNYKWSVPISYVTDANSSNEIFWFSYKENEFTIQKPPGIKWLKFNPAQIGYYRVNYENWTPLIENINEMKTTDRSHLLEEAFSIAESGELSYEIPLTLTKFLVNETHYVPWSVASSKLQGISNYLQTSQYDSDFKRYVIGLLKPLYRSLSWNDDDNTEPHLTKLTRVAILNLACVMGYDDALNEAKTRFEEWINNTSVPITPNLRSLIYKFGMVTADEATWNKLFTLFANETDANEKLKLMNGLANVRNPSLLTKLIELAKDETYVRSQDYFTLLQYIAGNPVGAPIVWDYVRENWLFLVDRFTLNDRYLGRLIPSITGRFSTNTKHKEMQRFFQDYPEAGAGTAARVQALETVSNNIQWLSKHKNIVENWIKNTIQSA